jgi:hypothetical protein
MYILWSDLPSAILITFFLAIATEAISEIITTSAFFFEMRAWFAKKANPAGDDDPEPAWYWVIIAKLVTCGYCMSVWVAGLLSALGGHSMIEVSYPADVFGLLSRLTTWAIMTFVIHRLSNWLHVGYSLFFKGRVHTHDINLAVSGMQPDSSTALKTSNVYEVQINQYAGPTGPCGPSNFVAVVTQDNLQIIPGMPNFAAVVTKVK